MITPTDNELRQMANDFDGYLLEFCEHNLMSPLAASGLIMARLTNMAISFGYSEDYTKLLKEIARLHETTQSNKPGDSSSLH